MAERAGLQDRPGPMPMPCGRMLRLTLALVLALEPRRTVGWSVLVLGGTGFRGHFTTESLVQEGHNVTVLSRGHSYWGIMEQLKGRITHWPCNRTLKADHGGAKLSKSSGLVNCTQLVNSTTFFDAVVDFSSGDSLELKQAMDLLSGRVGIYIFISSHAIYDVSKNSTHGENLLLEGDAVRPGREISPLDRFALMEKSVKGNKDMESEEALMKQYNAGGFPFTALRITNTVGPKENTIRYWLLHLWVRAHLALTLPLHLDTALLDTPISFTYTPDIAQAVVRVIAKSQNETCCPEQVWGEAFNLACEEAPNQRTLYNRIAEPIGMPYVETIEMHTNSSIVLYPDILRGPVSVAKALDVLRWSPTDLGKAARSVARFYDRIMLDESKYKLERDIMYGKCKRMLSEDGPRFAAWIRAYYAERRKTELYDELDDEDEDDIVLVRKDPDRRKAGKKRRKRSEL
mmetsp:Transcript_63057/g.138706  ORF Transcript_63057/g.138706 Transcript_63057/m.138706 type:complete len:459 (+) Transcript_63057:41-1417(+)